MTSLAVVTMLVICGTVWGGFAALVVRAVRRESAKVRDRGSRLPPSGPAPEQG